MASGVIAADGVQRDAAPAGPGPVGQGPAISLKALQAFRVLAELRHFGRAAERLGISQPPLSIRIRQLEAALGAPLFERSRAGVSLTAAGLVLQREAGPLFEHLARALDQVQATARGDAGDLRIGFVTPAEFSFLPDRLREFRARAPGVRLHLSELTGDAQLRLLVDGGLDVGFVVAPVQLPSLAWRPILRERLMVALPARHRLARERAGLSAAMLTDDPLVIFPRDKAPGLHDRILAVYPEGHPIQIGQEAIQMPTIVSLVAAGLGIAIVPESLRNLGRRGVVYRPLADSGAVVETGICWRVDESAAVCLRFVEFVTAAMPVPAREPRRARVRGAASARVSE